MRLPNFQHARVKCAAFAVALLLLQSEDMIATTVTNLAMLRQLSANNPSNNVSICIEGDVWWASPDEGRLVMHDASGTEELELSCTGPFAQAGQRVLLEGEGTIALRGAALKLGAHGPVVDYNGIHLHWMDDEKFASVYLKTGLNPFRVDWLTERASPGIQVKWEGPKMPCRPIPDSLFFITNAEVGGHWLPGLNYECYEGRWDAIPDFDMLTPVRTGTVSYLDTSIVTRSENVAVRFTGFLYVPRDGLCTFHLRSAYGSRLFVGEPTLRFIPRGTCGFPEPRRVTTGQTFDVNSGLWASVEGEVTWLDLRSNRLIMELTAGAGRLGVEVANFANVPVPELGSRIRATGFCQSAFTTDGQRIAGTLFVPAAKALEVIEPPSDQKHEARTNTLPLLTRASDVRALTRAQALLGYPVRLRGVVTCEAPDDHAFVLQDSTRGIYVVDFSSSRSSLTRLGEYLEVEGTTDPGIFAPMVDARRVANLGGGQLPVPIKPSLDELINGSLDAQYVEIRGIISSIRTNGIVLRTSGGVIQIELGLGFRQVGPEPHKLNENALVRVRGCLFADWDFQTHQVKVGEIRIYNARIIVDSPERADPFARPTKSIADLFLFNPQASALERVKVSGQIIGVINNDGFLMNGSNGLRIVAKAPILVRAGDLVEVVGFPDLSDVASPILRDAIVRKTGEAPLPLPSPLSAGNLLQAECDATRVRVEAGLIGVRSGGQVLELQDGVHSFLARLSRAPDHSLQSLAPGTRLQLVGVYLAQGSNRAVGQEITSFELLLDSPADVRVLARPPWWTLQRLLIVVGILALVLAGSVLWITQLHRRVEERTAELSTQIQARQRLEQQRALEQERTRVAQDLHDELGSTLTGVGMLASRASSADTDEQRVCFLEQLGDKVREMVTKLDEIVWATNPRHDTLASLVSYFCLYADRFLALANVACRFEGPAILPERVVDSRHRHQLFLAFKEALTNVVRHSRASEVRLQIQLANDELQLTVVDNGHGLPDKLPAEEMDGLKNMRSRLETLGGRLQISKQPGCGTSVTFFAPLN
jgi:signal transduction histidine kinase